MAEYGDMQDVYPLGSEKPDGPKLALDLATRLGRNRGAGIAMAETAADLTPLFADIDFTGFIAAQRDTGQVWMRRAGATIPLPVNVRRQLDTNNDTAALVVYTGIGKITGNATAAISEAVTFPVAFGSGVPIVMIGGFGSRATGTFNALALSAAGVTTDVSGVSLSGFTANIRATAALSAATDWYYSWIAFGAA